MSLTTDPNDPELKRGIDQEPIEQNKKYLILSEEERTKGFIRPVRIFPIKNNKMNEEALLFAKHLQTIQVNPATLNVELDYVYSHIEFLLVENDYSTVDQIFKAIEIQETISLVLLVILTATDRCKSLLKERNNFYIQVRQKVEYEFNKQTAKELLYDLE